MAFEHHDGMCVACTAEAEIVLRSKWPAPKGPLYQAACEACEWMVGTACLYLDRHLGLASNLPLDLADASTKCDRDALEQRRYRATPFVTGDADSVSTSDGACAVPTRFRSQKPKSRFSCNGGGRLVSSLTRPTSRNQANILPPVWSSTVEQFLAVGALRTRPATM
jgi:hypothetical protein